ncbi:fimbrillin family protein [uncultured Proteiniphilum sp.]|uniref:fimbrillin family protein n=1 Tax=uncultured Proteiniphilum sp. TaxID=497637 RepID=UPI0026032FF8|nr:fimbrillin family protein [uncultured Proteiniphilum sp.]
METFKLALVCLAASFLAVSCTDITELDDYNYETHGIRFTTSTDITRTRGLPVLSSDGIPGMGVFAYYTGDGVANNWGAQGATATPNYMNNIQITNSGGVWSYDDPVYWPQAADANVSFFAYSPHATAANGITMNVTTGIPSITYTVPKNCSDQPDLMVSALLQDRNKTNNGSSPVNFQMRHALTCIGFKASGNGEKIEKITVSGVKRSGELTVAADGTPSWDLSGSVNESFDAIVDDGVYLGPTAELVNTGGGYLMMVPQTLGTGATLTVELDSERSFDFDLEGLTWGVGQFINYNLSITPEAALLLTPEKIVLPPMGGFSEFNVTVANGSSLDWTIAINNPGFLICDNLADILSWASGTMPAVNVRNLDTSTPGTSFTGMGTKTLYVWKPTANSSTSVEITGTISYVIDPTGASIAVIQLPDYPMTTVRDDYMSGEYVGAFWKANQKGERIIRIPVGSGTTRAGDWDASVFWMGPGWKAGDIVFSNDTSGDPGVTYNSATENPANMLTNDATYVVPGYVSSASGDAVSGSGNYIHFRIGLTSTYSPLVNNPARYALVLLRYGTPQKYHIIYIRQGEEADYLMYPTDNARGPAAMPFCAYNVTASDLTDDEELVEILPGRSNAVFTDYPTQAGAFFQWSYIYPYGPMAYHPVKPVTPIIWNDVPTGSYWNTLASSSESCPPGYRRPNDSSISAPAPNVGPSSIINSEVRQSLYASPMTGNGIDNTNLRWGFYADGYFDRRDHNNPFISSPEGGGSAMALNTAVSWQTKDVAYIGSLLFNPVAGSPRENASLFIPAAGNRYTESGSLIEGGEASLILSSSASSANDMWYYVSGSFGAQQLFSTRTHALSLRCVPD